jgi:hypothetical protein
MFMDVEGRIAAESAPESPPTMRSPMSPIVKIANAHERRTSLVIGANIDSAKIAALARELRKELYVDDACGAPDCCRTSDL